MGMMPPTMGKSSQMNEHNQDNTTWACSEGHSPLIPASVKVTEANTSEITYFLRVV